MTTRATEMPATGSCGLMYSAGKAAFNKLPDFIHFKYGKQGIHAFLIEPNFTMTDTLRSMYGSQADAIGQGYAPREPIETARTAVWLASHADAPNFAGPGMINAPNFFWSTACRRCESFCFREFNLGSRYGSNYFFLTKLMVRDVALLERFYLDVLGFGHVRRIEEGKGEHAFIEVFLSVGKAPDGAQLVLMQYLNQPAPSPGEAQLGLLVDDVDATVAAVQSAGGSVAFPAFTIPEHFLRMAYVADPEEHTLELMQYLSRKNPLEAARRMCWPSHNRKGACDCSWRK